MTSIGKIHDSGPGQHWGNMIMDSRAGRAVQRAPTSGTTLASQLVPGDVLDVGTVTRTARFGGPTGVVVLHYQGWNGRRNVVTVPRLRVDRHKRSLIMSQPNHVAQARAYPVASQQRDQQEHVDVGRGADDRPAPRSHGEDGTTPNAEGLTAWAARTRAVSPEHQALALAQAAITRYRR